MRSPGALTRAELSGKLFPIPLIFRTKSESLGRPGCLHQFTPDFSAEWKKGAYQLRALATMPDWIPYDLPRTYLTTAESLYLNAYTLKALANHRQPRNDLTGGYLKLSAERLRTPAQQMEDKLLKLAGVKPGAEVLKFPGGERKQQAVGKRYGCRNECATRYVARACLGGTQGHALCALAAQARRDG